MVWYRLTFFIFLPFSTIFFLPEKRENILTAYPEHLSGAYTGGFGEGTCHTCHFDYPLNMEDGKLLVEGIPEEFKSGQSYIIHISVNRPGLQKAGFQLTARFPNGRQAGMFGIPSDRVQFTDSLPNSSIQYVQHSAKGTEIPGGESTSWDINWTAPSLDVDTVIFNIAANAANGDASPFGDYILTDSLIVPPSPQ